MDKKNQKNQRRQDSPAVGNSDRKKQPGSAGQAGMLRRRKSVLSGIIALLLLLAGYTGWLNPLQEKNSAPGQAQEQQISQRSGEQQASAQASQADKEQQGRAASSQQQSSKAESGAQSDALQVEESGTYTSKEEVAAYLHAFGHLPDNFITKKEAKRLGWVSSEGNLDEVAPGKSIGGDSFGNYEGNLPEESGRKYYECDIDSDGGYRNAKRLVYSDDGLIYYTEDHYETFELLYGEE